MKEYSSLESESAKIESLIRSDLIAIGLKPFTPAAETLDALKENDDLRAGGVVFGIHTEPLTEDMKVAVVSIINNHITDLSEVQLGKGTDDIVLALINKHLN